MIHDIEVSLYLQTLHYFNDCIPQTATASVQQELTQKLMFLFLNLEKDQSSDDAKTCLECDQEELIESLIFTLSISTEVPHKRRRLDETQTTSLFCSLLKAYGDRFDAL